jgi:hypothetical protein
VLAAIQRAPIVPFTPEEEALLEEVDWAASGVPHAKMLEHLESLRPSDEK